MLETKLSRMKLNASNVQVLKALFLHFHKILIEDTSLCLNEKFC